MKQGQSSSVPQRLGIIALAVLGATSGTSAFAQFAAATPHGYVGGNIGRTWSDFDGTPATTPPAALSLTSEDDRELGFKLFGGYQFHRNFAVEGGFYDLGRFDYTYGGPAGTVSGSTRFRGLNLDLVGTLPITDRFSAFGRVGAAWTQSRVNVGTTGALTGGGSRSERDVGVKFGAGLEYAFTPSLSVRAEWERYRLEDPVRRRGHVDMASVGLVYRFGAPAVTRVVAPAPAPAPAVIPAPAPAPRVVTPPPPAPAPAMAPPPPPAPAPAPLPTRPYRN